MRTLESNKFNFTKGFIVARIDMIAKQWNKEHKRHAGENIIQPLKTKYYDLTDYNIKVLSLQKRKFN